MKTAEWDQIEKEFIEWDNEGHSNASQRQILNWFMVRLLPSPDNRDAIIEKQREIIECLENRINENYSDIYLWHSIHEKLRTELAALQSDKAEQGAD